MEVEWLEELRSLRFHPPKQLLAFAEELGARSEPAPCLCVGGVGGERFWLSPGGLKSQLEEGVKGEIKAAWFSSPHVFSQACKSSSEVFVCAWKRLRVCYTKWRCCVGVCDPEGLLPWSTPPAPTANPEESLTPLAGCTWRLLTEKTSLDAW